jgi:hypothetical protein
MFFADTLRKLIGLNPLFSQHSIARKMMENHFDIPLLRERFKTFISPFSSNHADLFFRSVFAPVTRLRAAWRLYHRDVVYAMVCLR